LRTSGILQPVAQDVAGVLLLGRIGGRQEPFIDADEVFEGHRRDRRRVAERLKFHVPAVAGALELHHDEPAFTVDTQQIDASVAALEVAELLSHNQQAVDVGSASE
jgi:hypothetical protein